MSRHSACKSLKLMVCHESFLTMLLYDHQISVIAQNFVLITASASSQLTPSFQALLLLLRLYTACMHHRAKSEISYVFYVHDRCRIGLIHMSATNPIEEI